MESHQEKRDQVRKDMQDDTRRRRRELILIGIFVLVLVLMLYIQVRLSDIAGQALPVPMATGFMFLLFWNLIVILGLVVIFYTVRNVVKLVFERRRGVLGSSLRLRLVAAFIGLTLGPATVLFGVSSFFLNTSIERWFDPQVQNVFDTAKQIIGNQYDEDGEHVLYFARQLSRQITNERLLREDKLSELESFIDLKRQEYGLGMIEVYNGKAVELVKVSKPDLPVDRISSPSRESLGKALSGQEGYYIEQVDAGDIIRGFEPIMSSWEPESHNPVGVVVVDKYIGKSLARQLRQNIMAIEEYEELKRQEPLIKRQHFTLLVFITLAVIFLAVWFGFYTAKGITVPIQLLAEGTQAVAAGDLDYRIDIDAEDELGTLVHSFNKMTGDLSTSRVELDQRRRYMEIVLGNVAAGVISLDGENNISTINKAAEQILRLEGRQVLSRPYVDVLMEEYRDLISELILQLENSAAESVQRQVSWHHEGRTQVLVVTLNILRDEDDKYIGLVAVLEEITSLVRAQRALAWREVARRIAHEIKNPLTPIKLAAQRLERRYRDREQDTEAKVVTDCTSTIIKQVDELKNLVNEFSNFARLPSANPSPADLNSIIREVMALYREAHRRLEFEFIAEERMPVFELDSEQMNRVFINLLDNAVASIPDRGRIVIETMYNEQLHIARVEIRDSGIGIADRDRDKLFDPYFSTKAGGSGLGLAIVLRIISDHNGYIRVMDNKPGGTVFVIELPAVAADMISQSGNTVRIIG